MCISVCVYAYKEKVGEGKMNGVFIGVERSKGLGLIFNPKVVICEITYSLFGRALENSSSATFSSHLLMVTSQLELFLMLLES